MGQQRLNVGQMLLEIRVEVDIMTLGTWLSTSNMMCHPSLNP